METVATAHGIAPASTGDRRRAATQSGPEQALLSLILRWATRGSRGCAARRQAIRGIGSRERAADGCRPAEGRVRASGRDVLCQHDEGTPSNPGTGDTPRRAPGPARRAPSWTADGPRSRDPTFGSGEAT